VVIISYVCFVLLLRDATLFVKLLELYTFVLYWLAWLIHKCMHIIYFHYFKVYIVLSFVQVCVRLCALFQLCYVYNYTFIIWQIFINILFILARRISHSAFYSTLGNWKLVGRVSHWEKVIFRWSNIYMTYRKKYIKSWKAELGLLVWIIMKTCIWYDIRYAQHWCKFM
jgi:hypothetical protein